METLTHSGQKILDKDTLKKLKNICKYAYCYTFQAIIFESCNRFSSSLYITIKLPTFSVAGFLMAMWNMPTIYLCINLGKHMQRSDSVPFKYVMNSLGKTDYFDIRLQTILPIQG